MKLSQITQLVNEETRLKDQFSPTTLYTGTLYISQKPAHSWYLRECWNVIVMINVVFKKKTSEM